MFQACLSVGLLKMWYDEAAYSWFLTFTLGKTYKLLHEEKKAHVALMSNFMLQSYSMNTTVKTVSPLILGSWSKQL